ncbi:MAG: argininosuccinate lyase [Planctomycetes bacterium]|nr:argininosuccinate lyase [Planctomycetota bacterium]
MSTPARPVWDRGDPIDPAMLAFTTGDDPILDRRLVEQDLQGSLAHAEGLLRSGWITDAAYASIRTGLLALQESFRKGGWTVEATDEDVHSAVERRLIESIGDAGKRLHTCRSRNEQIAVDVRLWLRDALGEVHKKMDICIATARALASRHATLPLPGYTHLRRAMPSTVGAWAESLAFAFEEDVRAFSTVRDRIRFCPLGSGAGYGVPGVLDREFVAKKLGFDGPESPVTAVQWTRGRAELAYLTELEGISLNIGKVAFDLWLFTTKEFGFAQLPVELTTGSSMMPQKRNPDLLELLRAQSRQTIADRAALLDALRDLPHGYHRDFQLLKGPLFRAHDRVAAMLPLLATTLQKIEWNENALRAACADPSLRATERALDSARAGTPFRDAYREESVRRAQENMTEEH